MWWLLTVRSGSEWKRGSGLVTRGSHGLTGLLGSGALEDPWGDQPCRCRKLMGGAGTAWVKATSLYFYMLIADSQTRENNWKKN